MSGASEDFSRFALVIDVEDSLGRGRLSIQRSLQKPVSARGGRTLARLTPWGKTY
jgi:hypothetical protein